MFDTVRYNIFLEKGSSDVTTAAKRGTFLRETVQEAIMNAVINRLPSFTGGKFLNFSDVEEVPNGTKYNMQFNFEPIDNLFLRIEVRDLESEMGYGGASERSVRIGFCSTVDASNFLTHFDCGVDVYHSMNSEGDYGVVKVVGYIDFFRTDNTLVIFPMHGAAVTKTSFCVIGRTKKYGKTIVLKNGGGTGSDVYYTDNTAKKGSISFTAKIFNVAGNLILERAPIAFSNYIEDVLDDIVIISTETYSTRTYQDGANGRVMTDDGKIYRKIRGGYWIEEKE
jgi:hypothetical protein